MPFAGTFNVTPLIEPDFVEFLQPNGFWIPSKDGSVVFWGGSKNEDEALNTLQVFIDFYMVPLGHELNGQVRSASMFITVEHNIISFQAQASSSSQE